MRRISTRLACFCLESPTLDRLDRQIIHALTIRPRASFRALAAVIGVSDQTVARRYRRLQDSVGLRVRGTVQGAKVGWVDWIIRLQCTPGSALAVAEGLSVRGDTSWVRLASGGTEIVFLVQARNQEQRDALLLRGLPGSRRVVQISAHSLLRVFSRHEWAGLGGALSPQQVGRLHTGDGDSSDSDRGQEAGHGWQRPLRLQPVDLVLLAELAFDGRASAAALAIATRWHESVVRRRIGELARSGVLYFDVDIETEALGLSTSAMLWLAVEPSQLEPVGQAVATHPEVPFVAATTGPTNLLVTVHCHSPEHLYRYLTVRLQSFPGVRTVETVPLIRTLKRSGALHPPP